MKKVKRLYYISHTVYNDDGTVDKEHFWADEEETITIGFKDLREGEHLDFINETYQILDVVEE